MQKIVRPASLLVGAGILMKMFSHQTQDSVCAPSPQSPVQKTPAMAKNSAFLFIKPHANTEETQKLVTKVLGEKKVNILAHGLLEGKTIDEKMLIDNHYYAIASKATILKPDQLNVPAEKFKAKFGLGWQEALDKGVVYNAKDACEKLGLDATGIDKKWAEAKKAGNLIKFGGGFYCGLIGDIYVFNGFFMEMRSKYVAPGASLYWYSVEWDAKECSWEAFRDDVLGPTDPTNAPAGSLRGQVMANWQKLGLKSIPNVGDNGVHGSASPFEAMCERMNWMGVKLNDDPFGKLLLKSGVPEKTITDWSLDPQVTFGAKCVPVKGSLFDSVENTDTDMCVALLTMINNGLVGSE